MPEGACPSRATAVPAGSVQIANPVVCSFAERRNRPAAIARDGDSPSPNVRARICKRICGCESPPIVPSTAASRPSRSVTIAGVSVCGGCRPGAYSGRVPFLDREAEPAVVQVDARRRLEQVAPEARGVRLDERHADAVPVDDAQRGRVADSRADTEMGGAVDGDRLRDAARGARCSRARGRRPRRASTAGRSWPACFDASISRCAQSGSSASSGSGRPSAIHALERRR